MAAMSERFTVSALRPTRRAGALSRVKWTPSTMQSVVTSATGPISTAAASSPGPTFTPAVVGQTPTDVLQQPTLTDLSERLREEGQSEALRAVVWRVT